MVKLNTMLKLLLLSLFSLFGLAAHAGGILPSGVFNQQTLMKVKQLAAGGNHLCAILEDSTTKCWGSGASGMTLHGNTNDIGDQVGELRVSKPIDLGTGRHAISIGLGLNHSCAVLDNGTLKCWGENTKGQLGNAGTNSLGDAANELGDSLPVVNLGTGRTALQVVGGFDHTCALLDNHTVKCWGGNDSGQLGIGSVTDSGATAVSAIPIVNLGTGRTATQLVATDRMTCALLDNSTVKCWGANQYGQLGQGNTTGVGGSAASMTALAAIDFGTGKKVLQITNGIGYHNCALMDNHQVKCWGAGPQGQLGNNSGAINIGSAANQMGSYLADISLGTGRSAVQIASGAYHSCALLDNNTVKCWGASDNGALGHGTSNYYGNGDGAMGDSLPITDFGTGKIVQLITGGIKTCVIMEDGTVKCVGEGGGGQMGHGSTADVGLSPSDMGNSLKVMDFGRRTSRLKKVVSSKRNFDPHLRYKQMASLGYHNCAIMEDSTLKCWGQNTYGQLGLGDTTSRGATANQMGESLPAVNVGAGLKVRQVAVGGAHTCALLDNSQIKCWGDNSYGQLGKGDTNAAGTVAGDVAGLTVVNLGTGRSAVQIATGSNHSCAILDDSTIKCWGLNSSGQLGINSNSGAVLSPSTAVAITEKAVQITAGDNITCALLDTSQVKCWGQNDHGQLGQNSTTNLGTATNTITSMSAINLGSGASASSIAAGGSTVCAVLTDASIKCWGNAGTGQLGQGNTTDYGTAAAPMTALSAVNIGSRKAIQVAPGYYHTCFLTELGSVKCFGLNASGQLGLGSTVLTGYPADLGDNLVAVNLGAGRTATQIVSGITMTCAVLDNGAIKCWGASVYGELGQGNTNNISDDASEVGEGIPVVNLGIVYK